MGIVVQKFGGSSVATSEKLELVIAHIINEKKEGNDVVVVVSAQGKTTDRLIAEEAEISKNPDKREHDVLVSTGEQVTIAKLAMMLIDRGQKAVSLTGWQIPIITNSEHTNSRIRYINNETILDYLRSDNIVIVAGFQGVDESGNITTLGRGGSDTTAVALAASLEADKCDIYTDVDGVYTSDPRIIPEVRKLKSISYDEMLEMASMGAKVLHNRCVEIARKFDIKLYVKSTFIENSEGTLVSNKNIEDLEISGVTKDVLEFNLDEIKTYRFSSYSGTAYEDTEIPTLEEALQCLVKNNAFACVELKNSSSELSESDIEDIYDIIKGSFLPRNTIVIKEFSFIFDIKLNAKGIRVISYIF